MTTVSETKYPYLADFARRLGEQRAAEAKAEAVLVILGTRGVEVSREERERIMSCTDLDQLDRWVKRAITAATAQDLFIDR